MFWASSDDDRALGCCCYDSICCRCFFWDNSLHCLGFFTSDTLGVDVANLKCHYDCSSCLYLFDYPFLFLAGRDLDNSAITVGYFPL